MPHYNVSLWRFTYSPWCEFFEDGLEAPDAFSAVALLMEWTGCLSAAKAVVHGPSPLVDRWYDLFWVSGEDGSPLLYAKRHDGPVEQVAELNMLLTRFGICPAIYYWLRDLHAAGIDVDTCYGEDGEPVGYVLASSGISTEQRVGRR